MCLLFYFFPFSFLKQREKEEGTWGWHNSTESLTKFLEELWDKSESFPTEQSKAKPHNFWPTQRPLAGLRGAPWRSLAEPEPALRKENKTLGWKGRMLGFLKCLWRMWKEAGRCWGARGTQGRCAALDCWNYRRIKRGNMHSRSFQDPQHHLPPPWHCWEREKADKPSHRVQSQEATQSGHYFRQMRVLQSKQTM